MRKLRPLLILLWIVPAILQAQPKTTTAWTANFKSPINWQRIHSLGTLIVSTNDALYGVNPADGTISWENKTFAALDPSMMEEIAGTEFLSISYAADHSSKIPLQAIVKVLDGQVLFDSKKERIGVLSRHVL